MYLEDKIKSKAMRTNLIIATCRVILGFFLRFVLTPLAIAWLGVADYGLWAAVSATLALMGVISEALSSSSQRQLTAAIASDDTASARAAFTVSFTLFSCISAFVILLGFLLKGTFLSTLEIPTNRINEASVLYWISVLGMVMSLLSVPYQGLLVASHKQGILTAVQLVPTSALLVVVLLMKNSSISPVIGFGVANCLAVGLTALLSIASAKRLLPAARFCRVPNFRVEFLRFFDFAMWNLFGRLNWILRNAGTTVLLSSHFGNIAAAGFTVSNNLILSALQFTFAFSGVVQAQMTAAEVKGKREEVCKIASGYSLTQSLIGLGVVMVVWFHGDTLLQLWLKTPPQGGATFLLLAAIYQTAAFVSIGESMIMEARGQIRGVTLMVAIPQLIGFAIGACILMQGYGNQFTLPLIFVIASITTSYVLRPWYLSWTKVMNPVRWLVDVVLPVTIALGTGLLLVIIQRQLAIRLSGVASLLINMLGWSAIFIGILFWKLPHLFTITKGFRKEKKLV